MKKIIQAIYQLIKRNLVNLPTIQTAFTSLRNEEKSTLFMKQIKSFKTQNKNFIKTLFNYLIMIPH